MPRASVSTRLNTGARLCFTDPRGTERRTCSHARAPGISGLRCPTGTLPTASGRQALHLSCFPTAVPCLSACGCNYSPAVHIHTVYILKCTHAGCRPNTRRGFCRIAFCSLAPVSLAGRSLRIVAAR